MCEGVSSYRRLSSVCERAYAIIPERTKVKRALALRIGRGACVLSRAHMAMRLLLLALLQHRAEASGGGQTRARGGSVGALPALGSMPAGGTQRGPEIDSDRVIWMSCGCPTLS